MTVITIQFKRSEYASLDDAFITDLREQIERSNRERKVEDLSFTIKEEFE